MQPESDSVVKSLYADAGSGIIFNFFGDIRFGDRILPEGVIMLPVKYQAGDIALTAGARLAGIRFHPAIGYGVLGKNYEKPTLLMSKEDQPYNLYKIYSELHKMKSNKHLIAALSLWATNHLDFVNVIPDHLEHALDIVGQGGKLGKLGKITSLSQRQLERHFKSWLGMTPKHYQRVLRIKKTLCFLRSHQTANLADVAQQFGYSDQAHMTREFRAIAHITPKQV